MAHNHFRQIAERVQEVAASASHVSADQRADLEHAAKILCRLEQLKRDLLSSDYNDDTESDRLAAELMALLGIHPSEPPQRI